MRRPCGGMEKSALLMRKDMALRQPRKRQKTSQPATADSVLSAVLQALGGGPERARLCRLWQNWSMVMGPELAPLTLPLGHHKDLLLIGAEDAMLVQELHLLSNEILERVNAFMESPFFSAVKVSLTLDKTVLAGGAPRSGAGGPALPLSDPEAARRAVLAADAARLSGNFLARMDPASPVARCYARFAVRQTRCARPSARDRKALERLENKRG